MKILTQILAFLFAVILTSLLGGFVLQKLWEWFIVPTFGVNTLTLIQSIGLSFFISYIKLNMKKDSSDEDSFEEIIANTLAKSIVFTILTLSIGYVITLFM